MACDYPCGGALAGRAACFNGFMFCEFPWAMNILDLAALVFYFAIVLGAGVWYRRRAARNVEAYFLGGRSLHWLGLAMSGSVATFDITGTMWIVTLITLFGMKSMWNHWMWGFLMAAFFMSYMGKWVRRSGVMTGAEWMVTRFGDRRDGCVARLAYTLLAVVMLTGFIGYAFQGIGKFGAVYVNWSELVRSAASVGPTAEAMARFCADHRVEVCAVTIFALTTLYVLLGGLYGVVVTNVIQTLVLTAAGVMIAVIAYRHVTPETVAAMRPADGTSLASLMPCWRLASSSLPVDYAVYEFFGALVIMWVVKGLLLNLGGPGQMTDFQAFLAARSPQDASKLGAAWSVFLVVRWAMCMGIALLALSGLAGRGDAEQAMPVVLQAFLPPGVRGLVIAGLLAAFMSTFSATVNAAASYLVRDLWQPLVRWDDQDRRLVWAGYGATVAVVAAGMAIGLNASSIRQVWDWVMMAVGAAFVVPNVLRWYWWRLNGWGYAAGTVVGMAAALALPVSLKLTPPSVPWLVQWASTLNLPYVAFPVVSLLSAIGCLVGTWTTKPTDEVTLARFFRTVRPFGLWKPIRRVCASDADQASRPGEGAALALFNVAVASTAIIGAYLAPMYLVGHWHHHAATWCAVALVSAAVLYVTWYRNLARSER